MFSVLLGFGITAWGERRADRRTVAAAIANFRAEIQMNLETLERVQPKHAQFAERLAEAAVAPADRPGETGFDVFIRLLPEGGLDTPPLREAAWETAQTTGALSLLDYDLAATLSETYLFQRSSVQPTLRLLVDRLYAARNFDPSARDALVRVHRIVLTELAGLESYQIELYRRSLERLPESEVR